MAGKSTSMKLPLLILFAFLAVQGTAQQKQHIFVSAELYKTYGLSAVYSRMLGGTRLGLGASVDIIDIGTQKFGGIMPGLDLRYYQRLGRSTLIPLVQAGYNFYRFDYQKPGTNEHYTLRGGFSYAFGLGYSYAVNTRGGGPFVALKYRSLQYTQTDPLFPWRNSTGGLKLSVGWRF